MRALRDAAAFAAFLALCGALLYLCSGGDEVRQVRRVIREPQHAEQQPQQAAKKCNPPCEKPYKCVDGTCTLTANVKEGKPDLGVSAPQMPHSDFLLIYDWGEQEPGDVLPDWPPPGATPPR